MHALKQRNPSLYLEVLQKQAEVGEDLLLALTDTWRRQTISTRTVIS
jgi:hypothetical protein